MKLSVSSLKRQIPGNYRYLYSLYIVWRTTDGDISLETWAGRNTDTACNNMD